MARKPLTVIRKMWAIKMANEAGDDYFLSHPGRGIAMFWTRREAVEYFPHGKPVRVEAIIKEQQRKRTAK